ncbi:MAG: HPr family phosphocarrier protein [Caldicoprobacter oshimai]|uniref:Phosphocarrier protein HPr n=1 Tax=Caldicoprobacter faecalis TaxID=937334 RepID=A0A1I5UGZ1_9FIRM|nr:HPr family phosphocarrier protein [Caldicoprobacter faecalis]PZN11878.1 MAG: HPr family phosphocarrier protein [Caldicoprobacter oshimai]SFP94448.1 phosphocarrier protein [Caldicoprobacter faecalis]
MLEKDFVIENEVGLHARPAAKFTKVANSYKSEIFVIKDGKIGNGKSLLSILALGIYKGCRFRVQVVGPDEAEALCGITKLINSNFEE